MSTFASNPAATRGRLMPEAKASERTDFQRDRDRVVHSSAFRRLQYKTQVFVYHEGDHYRTRLTHSLEVAQIARSLARALALNEDLAEAVALAHDLGHPPFGHAGEDALNQVMAPFGGFDHNDQTLRVLTELERRYAAFDGLNLTWETLEGVAKHNGPMREPPPFIAAYQARQDLALETFPSAEAQLAALADDIAYNNHDLDDGLRARLFAIEDIADLPLVGPVFAGVMRDHPELETPRLIHEAIRRLVDHMARDVLTETRARIAEFRPASADDVRDMGRPLIAFSPEMQAHNRTLKGFLFERMYRHYRVNRATSKAKRVVRDLFELFLKEPNVLPTEWQRLTYGRDDTGVARIVADYIAGMTDRYAFEEHKRLFDLTGTG
jgi:dGTPase